MINGSFVLGIVVGVVIVAFYNDYRSSHPRKINKDGETRFTDHNVGS